MPNLSPTHLVRDQKPYRRSVSRFPVDLRLDANEGSSFAGELLAKLKLNPDSLRRYPDASELEQKIANQWSIHQDQVVVTAGADDALERVCRATLETGRSALYCTPTFEMIHRYVRATGAEGIEIPWLSGDYPVETLIDAGQDANVLFVVSPNNPTGKVASIDDLERLREALPFALLVLDAAYGEFAEQDLTRIALSLPRTIVTRTFSKAYGAAGLRVGYAMGDPQVIDWLRVAGQPYAVSGLSIEIALHLISAEATVRKSVDRIKDERDELLDLLRSLGAEPIPGQANFVLTKFDEAYRIADLLEELGILVRRFPLKSDLQNYLRIGCPGDEASFNRLKKALRTVTKT